MRAFLACAALLLSFAASAQICDLSSGSCNPCFWCGAPVPPLPGGPGPLPGGGAGPRATTPYCPAGTYCPPPIAVVGRCQTGTQCSVVPSPSAPPPVQPPPLPVGSGGTINPTFGRNPLADLGRSAGYGSSPALRYLSAERYRETLNAADGWPPSPLPASGVLTPPGLAIGTAQTAPCAPGSRIECQKQILSERIPLVGTPYFLVYRSDRLPGYIADRYLRIPLTAADVSGLRSISVTVEVAGQLTRQVLAPKANTVFEYAWNGKDDQNNAFDTAQALVRVDYLTELDLTGEARNHFTFATPALQNSGGSYHLDYSFVLGHRDIRRDSAGAGLGGWTLSVHHSFDPALSVLTLGDGPSEVVPPDRVFNTGSDLDVFSADGTEWYRFDATGRHLATYGRTPPGNFRTFEYDARGVLLSLLENQQGYQFTTRFTPQPASDATVLIAPTGESTYLAGTSNLTSVTSNYFNALPKLQTGLFYGTTSPEQHSGLLQQFVRESSATSTFAYECDGRLAKDTRPLGGSTRLAWSIEGGGFNVLKTVTAGELPEQRTLVLTQPLGADGERVESRFWTGHYAFAETTHPVDPVSPAASVIKQVLTGPFLRGAAGNTVITRTLTIDGDTATIHSETVSPSGARRSVDAVKTANKTADDIAAGRYSKPWAGTLKLSFTGRKPIMVTHAIQNEGAFNELRTGTVTSSGGRTSSAAFNPRTNRPISETDEFGIETAYEYDPQGRIRSARRGPVSIEYGYDTADQLISQTVSGVGDDGNVSFSTTRYTEFDLKRRATRLISHGGAVVDSTFDARGNLTGVKPPGRPWHAFTYDAEGRVSTYAPPPPTAGSGVDTAITTRYQPNSGLIDRVELPGGDRFNVSYLTLGFGGDLVSRFTANLAPATGAGVPAYDNSGVPSQFGYNDDRTMAFVETQRGTSAGPRLEFGYTDGVETSQTFRRLGGLDAVVVGRTLRPDGLAATSSVDRTTLPLEYDDDGLVTRAGAATFSRNARTGRVEAATVGTVVTRTQLDPGWRAPRKLTTTRSARVLNDTAFTYNGLRLLATQTETDDLGLTRKSEYGYDGDWRVRFIGDADGSRQYTYDDNGNRRSTVITKGATSSTVLAEYDDQDRLTHQGALAFDYTARGHLLHKIDNTDPAHPRTQTFTYGLSGDLSRVATPAKTIDYALDGTGRRVGRSEGGSLKRAWVYFGANTIAGEYNADTKVWSLFVYGDKPITPEYMSRRGKVYRIISDVRGSPRLVVDATSGQVMQRLRFDEWGQRMEDFIAPGFEPIPFGFAGGLLDRDTGLVHFDAREYDPEVGRWTSKDPTLFAGSGPNLYLYGHGDPVNFIDTDGRAETCYRMNAPFPTLGPGIDPNGLRLIVPPGFDYAALSAGFGVGFVYITDRFDREYVGGSATFPVTPGLGITFGRLLKVAGLPLEGRATPEQLESFLTGISLSGVFYFLAGSSSGSEPSVSNAFELPISTDLFRSIQVSASVTRQLQRRIPLTEPARFSPWVIDLANQWERFSEPAPAGERRR